MVSKNAKQKIVHKPSIQEQVNLAEGKFYHQNTSPQHRFFTEKKINHNNHRRYHSNLKANDGYRNMLRASIQSDKDQKLQYSQTELENQMMKTLEDLGIRSGLSFEKERIDFSLSSDIMNTEHQNQILKKKMNQMKKELQYLRDNDEKLNEQLWEQKIKNSNLQNQLSTLKKQFMQLKQKQSQNEKQGTMTQQEIQQNRKETWVNKAMQSQQKLDCLRDQLQNVKKLTQSYKNQINILKDQYEEKLKNVTNQLQKQLEQTQHQFKVAKEVGQEQINNLLTIIFHKDIQINLLRKKLARNQKSIRKKSTLISDNPQNLRHQKRERSKSSNKKHETNQYMIRFLEFQRLIDEKLSQSRVKGRKSRERVCRSAITGEKYTKYQKRLKENFQQRQNNNLSQLLQRNERSKYPDAAIERFHTQISQY